MENKVLKWAIIIGIVVIFNLFINYALSLVYKEPVWNDYFGQDQVVPNIDNKPDCLNVGGRWYEGDNVNNVPTKVARPNTDTPSSLGWCDPNFTNQKIYDAKHKAYERNVFIFLIVLGAIALVASTFLVISVLAIGFSWGGVLSLIIASIRYWSVADNWVKVLILGFALASLVWVAIKKFNKVS